MAYDTDLKDAEWVIIKDFFQHGNYGNRAVHDKRILVNAVIYMIITGCQWRMLPKDFPHWSTVHSFFRRAKQKGIWEKIMKILVEKSRIKMGRKPDPTYSLMDSQSVKTTGASQEKGIDGGKKNKRSQTTYCN